MSTNIKKAREAAGKSQKEIAVTLGVSAPTVSDWEAGKKFPSAKNLVQLSNYLGVSTDYLLGNEKSAPPEPDEATRKLIDLISSLPADQKTGLLLALQGLSGPQP